MPSTRELRRRIRSTRSTRQITKALELVSAAKMRRADVAIPNDGTREALRKTIREYHRAFELMYGG